MIDLDSLSENLFEILNKSDPYLQEIDIIDLRPNETTFIFEENCLVINQIYIKKLYLHLRDHFLNRDGLILTSSRRNQLTLLILLINAQFSSVWSQRKGLVCSEIVQKEHEFKLNSLILNKNVKSEHAYMHRRWLIKRCCFGEINIEDFLHSECELVYKISKKIKSNYYCWSYLNWLFEYFKDKLVNVEFLVGVFERHQKIVLDLSVSDFCVFHFRLNLFKLVLLEHQIFKGDDFDSLLDREFEIFDDFLFRYSKYQTVWNYRKYFLRIIELKQESLNVSRFRLDLNSSLVSSEMMKQMEMKVLDVRDSSNLRFLLKREMILAGFVKKVFEDKNEFVIVENYANLHCEFIKKFF
jgi:hypothetical protein